MVGLVCKWKPSSKILNTYSTAFSNKIWMEMMGYGFFQKCSGILNLKLAPAFRSKHDHIALHSDKLKPLNKNEAGVACSTLVLSNISRQRENPSVVFCQSSTGKGRGGETVVEIEMTVVHGLLE